MPLRKTLRVIEGGSHGDTGPAPPDLDVDQLCERARQLRYFVALTRNETAAGLVDDLEAAIGALQRLVQSRQAQAPRRAAEYRVLIAEIDAEILALLKDG